LTQKPNHGTNHKKHGQAYSIRARVIYARSSKVLILLGHHGASAVGKNNLGQVV